jgi:alpha-tubulin suppressor-like RCC1 family protein
VKILKITGVVSALVLLGILVTPISSASASCKPLTRNFGVDVGESTSYAWSKSGKAYSWGRGDWGMRGDGSTTYKKNKPQAVKQVKDVVKIVAYGGAALFLQRDGRVFSTGYNSSGQLGLGSTSYKKTPVKITSLTCIVDIAAGRTTSYALRADGTVWAWGYNASGELNVGNEWPTLKPRRVLGLSKIKSISAGEDNLFASSTDGRILALGYNYDGQLGVGHETDPEVYPSEVSVQNLKSLTTASDSAAGINANGEIVMWGDQGWVIPGISGGSSSTPVVLELGSNWKSITLGWSQALAVDNQSALWIWGSNQNGALGTKQGTYCSPQEEENNECAGIDLFGTGLRFKTTETPAKILDTIRSVASGNDFSLAVQTNGAVWAWGDGGEGQLGNGYFYDSDKPSRVYKLNLNK